ncbi:MAG: SixA phosphatase family protein [Arcticibacter sp.]
MKKLLIIRHAKSDWSMPGLTDFDRTLNSRGLRNAPEMAIRLKERGLIPEAVVASPAVRARTTAEIFCTAWDYAVSDILFKDEIYEASPSALLRVINELDDRYDSVALFGHNPGLTEIIVDLCNSDLYNLPTCGVVQIAFPFESWAMVSRQTGEQLLFDYPKNEEPEF